jgi:Homeodomain-like domain
MHKKYRGQLTTEQRTQLAALIHTGSAPARTQTHARILLKADGAAGGSAWTDDAIVRACEVSRPTVARVRRAFVTKGVAAALQRRRPQGPSPRRQLDGRQEAQLIALTCSSPPAGHERWTLTLLAERLVALQGVDSIARDTIRVTLKKMPSNRG